LERPPDLVSAIDAELARLRARPQDRGSAEGFIARAASAGNVVLQGTSHGRTLDVFAPATEILERIGRLPDHGGPDVVRAEFA
jgi:hypothetical protein